MSSNRFLRGPSVTDCRTMIDPLFFSYLPQGFKLLRIHPEYYDTTYVFEYDGKIYDLYLESDMYGNLTCLKEDTDKDSDFISQLSVIFDETECLIGTKYIQDKVEKLKWNAQHLIDCIEELKNDS